MPGRVSARWRVFTTAQMSSCRRIARLLFAPGDGFARDSLPAGAVRAWTDMQIVSHAAFVPAIAVATLRQPPLPELAALQAATLALSLAYHRNYERPGRLSKLEGSTAKTLFAYGAAQTYLSPTPECLAVNSSLMLATVGSYVVTNVDTRLYERWHPIGLHVAPGLWSLNVACNQESVLLLPSVMECMAHVSACI